MKHFLILSMAFLVLFAQAALEPAEKITTVGNIVDLSLVGSSIYVGTDAGRLEVFDIHDGKLHRTITFGKIHDFMDDLVDPKVLSVDATPKGDRLIMLVQREGGDRALYLEENGKQRLLLDAKKSGLQIRKVRFIDSRDLLFSTISNELVRYRIDQNKIVWRRQLSLSTFSDFVFSPDRTKVASTDESGIVHLVDLATGKMIENLDKGNKDNVFQLDYKNEHIIACGQDRRAALYDLTTPDSPYIYRSDFMIYSCALDQKARQSAFSIDDASDIGLFDNTTHTQKAILRGHHITPAFIIFLSEHRLMSADEGNTILFWRLP